MAYGRAIPGQYEPGDVVPLLQDLRPRWGCKMDEGAYKLLTQEEVALLVLEGWTVVKFPDTFFCKWCDAAGFSLQPTSSPKLVCPTVETVAIERSQMGVYEAMRK